MARQHPGGRKLTPKPASWAQPAYGYGGRNRGKTYVNGAMQETDLPTKAEFLERLAEIHEWWGPVVKEERRVVPLADANQEYDFDGWWEDESGS